MSTTASMPLGTLDYVVFFGFVTLLFLIGFLSGRGERKNADEYFLAGRNLPWYAIGGSFVAANISTEQFIGVVGATFIMGITTALWDWLNAFTFMFMIFIFVPFLLHAKVVTIPEYLGLRFNPLVRRMFAVITIIANIIIFMAAVLYTGGMALSEFFGWPLALCIVLTGLFSGGIALYGGLSSVAWTGLFTAVVKFAGASAITVLGLLAVSGNGSIVDGFTTVIELNRANHGAWRAAMDNVMPHLTSAGTYNRLSVVQPLDHPMNPWLGLLFVVISVGIWYNTLNQFIVQRILGARDSWHARMGIVFAGYIKVLVPALTVLPGLTLFALHPELLQGDWIAVQHQADRGYVTLIKELLPIGMRGILLAVLFSAVQATITSVVSATATVFTYDIYKPLLKPDATDQQMVSCGVWSSAVVIVVGIATAIFVSYFDGGIFQYVQTLNAFFAPPFAAAFLLGLFWRRANSQGALAAIIGGFLVAVALKAVGYAFVMPGWFYPFGNQAGIIWSLALLFGIIASLITPAPAKGMTIYDFASALREGLGTRWYNSVILWWAGSFVLMIGVMLIFTDLVFPV